MKIDWKHLATTSGYKSLKAAYIRSVQEAAQYQQRYKRSPLRNKEELLAKFHKIICKAKHHAHVAGKPIHEIIDKWEARRTYDWVNYYNPIIKRLSTSIAPKKPMGIRGLNKFYKKEVKRGGNTSNSFADKKHQNAVYLRNKAGKKARWPVAKKKTK